MYKNAGMDLCLPHLMDHSIHRRMRELVDQHRIVMMRISGDLRGHRVAQKKRLVVEIDLDVHGNRVSCNLPTFALWQKRSLPQTNEPSPKNFSRPRPSASAPDNPLPGPPAGKAPSTATTEKSSVSPISGIL